MVYQYHNVIFNNERNTKTKIARIAHQFNSLCHISIGHAYDGVCSIFWRGFCKMKKVSVTIISVLILYIVYYDLTTGTLPLMKENFQSQTVVAIAESKNTDTKPFYEVKIKPGDTVLSIIEKNNPTEKMSITQIIQDFKKLNPKINPNKIQIGQIYKFPLYK